MEYRNQMITSFIACFFFRFNLSNMVLFYLQMHQKRLIFLGHSFFYLLVPSHKIVCQLYHGLVPIFWTSPFPDIPLLWGCVMHLFFITEPKCASVNRGVLICDECCSIHRCLGRHISQLKSLKKGSWASSLLAVSTIRID